MSSSKGKKNPTDSLSRRKVLQATATGLAAAALPTTTLATSPGSKIDWDATVDIVVCGSGAAGSTAALAAAHAGASVLVIEKSAVWGGTSAKSGFHIWIPNNNAMHAAGYQDDRYHCLRFMAHHSFPHVFDSDSPTLGLTPRQYALIETYFDQAATTIETLREWGIGNYQVATLGMDNIAAVDYNENSPWNRAPVGRSVELVDDSGRWHPGSYTMQRYRDALGKQGAQIRMELRVTALHRDNRGTVIGVAALDRAGVTRNFRARRGVIFGSGCYTANREFLNQYQNHPVMGGCGVPSNEGDFIPIAGSIGAQLGNLSGAWRAQVVLDHAVDFVSTPTSVFWPIGDSMLMVNKYGRRFINEKRNYNDRTRELYFWDANRCEYPNLVNFMIYDQRCADRYGGRYPIPSHDSVDYLIKADTLEALSDALASRLQDQSEHTGNLALADDFTEQLIASVKRFNTMARDGVDQDFARGSYEYDRAWHDMQRSPPDPRWPEAVNPKNSTMHPLQDKGPYYAIILLPGCIGTNGGPVINQHAQVLDYNEQPIPGLYGAGNCIASASANAYWGGGTTIGNAIIFGKIAGEHAAARNAGEETV